MKTIIEPIRMTSREQQEGFIAAADYNLFKLRAGSPAAAKNRDATG